MPVYLSAAKKVPGRKLGLAVDVWGLVVGAVVAAAPTRDNQVGTRLLDKVAEEASTVKRARVGQGSKNS